MRTELRRVFASDTQVGSGQTKPYHCGVEQGLALSQDYAALSQGLRYWYLSSCWTVDRLTDERQ